MEGAGRRPKKEKRKREDTRTHFTHDSAHSVDKFNGRDSVPQRQKETSRVRRSVRHAGRQDEGAHCSAVPHMWGIKKRERQESTPFWEREKKRNERVPLGRVQGSERASDARASASCASARIPSLILSRIIITLEKIGTLLFFLV